MAGSNREIKIGNATPNDILAIALEKGLSEEKAKEMFALAQAQADEERTKQERKTELQEEKAEDKKDAFDALAVEVDNKLRGKQFDEASKAINSAIGPSQKLSESDVIELRKRISNERIEDDKEKARKKTGELTSNVTNAISNAESKANEVDPDETVDISEAVTILEAANKQIDEVADFSIYVDQSVIARERSRISEAKGKLNEIRADKQRAYVENQQKELVDTVKRQLDSSRGKMIADPAEARNDLVVASEKLHDVEKIRSVNPALISEQRRLIEEQQKAIAEKERETVVNGIINTHILISAPDYQTAANAADAAFAAGRINESDRKRIVDLIDTERARKVSAEAQRIRSEIATSANVTELNRLEDVALASYGNKQITQAEFNSLNSEIQARIGVVTGRESNEKTKKETEKAGTTEAMKAMLKRGDFLPGGGFYNFDVFDTEVDVRVNNHELTERQGEDLKRQARVDYQTEEERIKADTGIRKIIEDIQRKFDAASTGVTFPGINSELGGYPSLTEREKNFIRDKFSKNVGMGMQAERDKATNMADVVNKIKDEIERFSGSPEVKAALEAKLTTAKKMLGETGTGGIAEQIAAAKLDAAKAEKFNLWMKERIVLAKYFGIPALLLAGGGLSLLFAGNPILTTVLLGGAAAGTVGSTIKYRGFGGKADFAKVKVQYLEKERDILKIGSELQDVPIAQARERAKFFAERYAAKHGIDAAQIPEVIKIWEKRFGLERTKELSDALNGIAQLT